MKQDGDLAILGSDLHAGGELFASGTNVTIGSAIDTYDWDTLTKTKHAVGTSHGHREGALTSQLTAGKDMVITATGKLNGGETGEAGTGNLLLQGATLQSNAGEIALSANNDVLLLEQQLSSERRETHDYRGGSLLSKKSSSSASDVRGTHSIGNLLSGSTISVTAGHDIVARASTLVGDGDVSLLAAHDVLVGASQDTAQEIHHREDKASGLFAGNASFTLGKQQSEQDRGSTAATHNGSQIASLGGKVTIGAGNEYVQAGSQVLAVKGDIDIVAKKVDIHPVHDSNSSSRTDKSRSSGLTVAVTGPMMTMVQTAEKMADAAAGTDDPRLQALAAAMAVLSVKNAADAIGSGKVAGVSVSLGSSKSESSSTRSSTTAVGSTIAAGNNVTITATGGGADSTLSAIGADIQAGNKALLTADGKIVLQAAQSTSEQHSSNKSSGGGIGLTFSEQGWGVNVSGNSGRGHVDGEDVVHHNTHVHGGKGVTLVSGGDTILEGAVVSSGGKVTAKVGGNLVIASLQDTSTYHSEQKSAGGSLTIGAGMGGGVNVGKGSVNSNYASVLEQSGIKAGDGGFEVAVAGQTELKGGVIASSETAVKEGKNSFVTQTLITSDIQNHAEANADSRGIGLSSDMFTQGNYGIVKGVIGNLLNNGSASESSSGVALSGISAGAIIITDEAKQKELTGKGAEETISELNRNTWDSNTAASRLDVEALRKSAEAMQAIKQEVFNAVTVYTDDAYEALFVNKPNFYKVSCNGEMHECLNDPGKIKLELINQDDAIRQGKVLAVNGILNDKVRASQLAYQNAPLDDADRKPSEITLMHIAPAKSSFGDVLAAGYEQMLAPVMGYSNADYAYADLLGGRGGLPTLSLGHSRGTIVQTNAFNILTDKGYANENLKVAGVGGAVLVSTYTDAAAKITSQAGTRNITYTYMANDPVSVIAAGNPGDALAALREFINVWKYSNSAHSCYGTGAVGCSTIANPVPGGPVPTNQQPNNVFIYEGGELIQPKVNNAIY